MRFLIVFDSSRFEDWPSLSRIISELARSCCLKVCVIASQFIVGIDLIQSVLIAEEFVLGEAHVVFLLIEFIGLFCSKVLTPTSRVVPMMAFKDILSFFIKENSIFEVIIETHELSEVAAIVPAFQLAHFEVRLPHLFLFSQYVEACPRLRVTTESLLRNGHHLLRCYMKNKVIVIEKL